MNVIKYVFVSIVLYCSLFSTSCNDPSIIGANLLDDESLNVQFSDTLTINMTTSKTDSVLTYSPGTPLFGYMLGDLNDPHFGYSESKLYTQFNVGFNNIIPTNSLVNGTIDSAVLVLNYESAGFFGVPNSMHTLSVHEMLEAFNDSDTLYSNMDFDFDPNPLGEIQFFPSLDSIMLTPHGEPDTSYLVEPQIRIPINTFFAKEMLDTSLWSLDTLFTEKFNGLHIRSSSSGESYFGLNLSGAAPESELNRLMVYITDDDTSSFQVQFDLRGVRHTEFLHDYSGSTVEPFIGNSSMGDSILFMQGMSGVDVDMDIPYIRNFKDYLINKVELEFFTAELMDDDTSNYSPIPNIVISRKNEDGGDVFIEDVAFAVANLNLELLFGGFLEDDFLNGFSVRKYTMNITEEVLSMIRDESKSTKMKVSAFVKSERPNRSVIFGPKHSTYPAKLKITFTEP